nr:acyl-CoA dehydrogenase family protein [Nocardioides convexus]
MNEYPIARLYADTRVTRIYGGTSEVMKADHRQVDGAVRAAGIPAQAGIPAVPDRCNGQEPPGKVRNPWVSAGRSRAGSRGPAS